MRTEAPTDALTEALREKGLRPIDLSRLLGVDKSTITRWTQRRVPAERVPDVERVTGIPRHQLRPDMYPTPEAAE